MSHQSNEGRKEKKRAKAGNLNVLQDRITKLLMLHQKVVSTDNKTKSDTEISKKNGTF